uniref:Uncharacterized protein n=1 Tax=Pipistrellus kuhlii TaxID=59472 RepID=A0A7J8B2I0_PIPKU|nr:hypothetical protein mPipKuh1_007897 [Pipistrellus kuhlii]
MHGFIKSSRYLPGLPNSVVERQPMDQSQGTCPGCELYPQCEAYRRQPINDFFSSLMFPSLSPSPFLSEVNKNICIFKSACAQTQILLKSNSIYEATTLKLALQILCCLWINGAGQSEPRIQHSQG